MVKDIISTQLYEYTIDFNSDPTLYDVAVRKFIIFNEQCKVQEYHYIVSIFDQLHCKHYIITEKEYNDIFSQYVCLIVNLYHFIDNYYFIDDRHNTIFLITLPNIILMPRDCYKFYSFNIDSVIDYEIINQILKDWNYVTEGKKITMTNNFFRIMNKIKSLYALKNLV